MRTSKTNIEEMSGSVETREINYLFDKLLKPVTIGKLHAREGSCCIVKQ